MTSAPQQRFDRAVAKFSLGCADSDLLPEVALAGLEAGLDSPSLAALAGESTRQHPADLRELFQTALAELGLQLMPAVEAAEFLKRDLARQAQAGVLQPREAAMEILEICWMVRDELGKSESLYSAFGISELVGWYYAWDDTEETDERAKTVGYLKAELERIATLDDLKD